MFTQRELDEHAAAIVLVGRLAERDDEMRAWLARFRAALEGNSADVAGALAEIARLLGLRILVIEPRG